MSAKIKYDAFQKLLNAPLDSFVPEELRYAKYSSGGGYLLEVDRLYSAMFHEWSTLQKDVTDTMEAVAALDWRVVPYVEQGAKPTPEALEAAEVVERAIWRREPQELGTYAHGFLDLTGAMLDALYRGYSVHEIIWRRSAQLVYPAEYRQVPAQFMVWEMREGERDRLLMVKDGRSYDEAVPFPKYRFIVALNNTGSDHPIYNSVYNSLIGFFAAAKFGLPWLQEYCQRYAHPVRVFKAGSQDELARIRADVEAEPDVHDVYMLNDGGDVAVTPIPGGASIPHLELLRVAENACHQAILGQTLTSDTADSGGSRAQAEVHMGVQQSVVLKRAEFVARVLNRQLVPAIVAMNYGRTEGVPLPEIQFAIPDDDVNNAVAEYWQKVLALRGVEVPKAVVYESLRIPMPAQGEEVIGGGAQQMVEQKDAEAAEVGDEEVVERKKKAAERPEGVSAARAGGAASGVRAWLAPLRAQLARMREERLSYEEMRARLRAVVPDTQALSVALAGVMAEGLLAGADVEAAEAANPYGCNGSGHRCPMRGAGGEDIERRLAGVEPVVVCFSDEKRSGAEWAADAQRFFMEHYAGRSFAIGETGHTLHVGGSNKRAKLAAKGVNTQKRNESFKRLEDVISRAIHISSETPQEKEGQGKAKKAILAKTATFEKYGAPASINGERCLIWFNAQTKEKGAKDVLFYEFGVSPMQKCKKNEE